MTLCALRATGGENVSPVLTSKIPCLLICAMLIVIYRPTAVGYLEYGFNKSLLLFKHQIWVVLIRPARQGLSPTRVFVVFFELDVTLDTQTPTHLSSPWSSNVQAGTRCTDVWMIVHLSTSPFTEPHCPARHLRYVEQNLMHVPHHRLSTYGRLAFAGASASNSLPGHVCNPNATVAVSRRLLDIFVRMVPGTSALSELGGHTDDAL